VEPPHQPVSASAATIVARIVVRRIGPVKICDTETGRSTPAVARSAFSRAHSPDSSKNSATMSTGTRTATPATRNMRRQSGRKSPEVTAATAPPIGNELSTNAAARPRFSAGQVSTT
jgi:hypothetical protein